FEPMRGSSAALFDDRLDCPDDRAADRHRRARGDRAEARYAVVAVAVLDLDRLDRNAEPLGREPAIQRAVPLPACLHHDRQQQFALAREGDSGALARLAAGDFEEAPNTEAAAPAAALGLPRARLETGDVCL